MRKLATALLVVCTTASALAQGTINFANRLSASEWAKVTDSDGVTGLSGGGYFAQLFANTLGTGEGALLPVGLPTTFDTRAAAAGAWIANPSLAIPGVGPGLQATAQVRAWFNNSGAVTTYAGALAQGLKNGKSDVFTTNPLGGPSSPLPILPPNMVGQFATDPMNAFSLVPEPSVIALGALGVVALLLRRRKA